MDIANDLAAARLDRFLRTEPVVWLSTVRPDGGPHLVPTWFAWDGTSITIVSKPGAQKVRNLRAHGRAMLALGDAEDDFDVGLIEATAELVDGPSSGDLPPVFLAKYRARIDELGLTPAQFAQTYAQLIRLHPTRPLGWHGRSTPRSVTIAAATVAARRLTSMAEPLRDSLRTVLGEPIGRAAPAL
ncbi:MAG TPA: pyridoxamine 5'-phosphate oxidase family protein [Candidatus Saccharimonadales bacterium]|nr:pyridoxamine 5'-phosphate oxidase family protein [Candidatus Saccharimonadales bacterium]